MPIINIFLSPYSRIERRMWQGHDMPQRAENNEHWKKIDLGLVDEHYNLFSCWILCPFKMKSHPYYYLLEWGGGGI